MFYKKPGFPEDSELVLCTVKKILPHSIFVDLDEYKNLEGMIHISEVSPGRIRNIRDFVKEGKKIVCKVLKIDKTKKHIDLSLRRVSVSMRKKKSQEYKQEQKSEKILENLAKKLKTNLENIYNKIGNKLIEEFGSLYLAFQSAIKEETDFKELKTPEKYRKELLSIVKEKIKLPEVEIDTIISLKSTSSNGIEVIKKCLKNSKQIASKKGYKLNISYISAPRYKFNFTSSDYKTAEKISKEVIEETLNFMKKQGGEALVL